MLECDRAVIFTGQGGQHVGMGKEYYDRSQAAKLIFEKASDLTGLHVVNLCFNNGEDLLKQTRYAQPAITTVNLAGYEVYREEYGEPGHIAGHSAAEPSAAAAAGLISVDDAIKLSDFRGKTMQQVGLEHPGAMAACIDIAHGKLKEICDAVGVSIANLNSNRQTVIAGLMSEMRNAKAALKHYGTVITLPVDVASHCFVMKPAEGKLEGFLSQIHVNEHIDTLIPFVSNYTAKYVENAKQYRKNAASQVANMVNWKDSIRIMVDHGADSFIEIGHGKPVLSRLTPEINPHVESITLKELLDRKPA